METVIQSDQGRGEASSSEESPLLPSGKSLKKGTVACSELLHLIPEGAPEVTWRLSSKCFLSLTQQGDGFDLLDMFIYRAMK